MATRLSRAEFLAAGLAVAGARWLSAASVFAASDQITIMQTEPPRSMDPADHTAIYTAAVLAPMYECLTKYDEKLTVIPSLATEWSANDAGTVWTFKLRSGVTFHDGTPCDAAAVVASFQRHLDPKRGLASSGRFRVVIDSVKATDATTAVFTLKAPYPAFTRLMAINNASIVSPTADKGGQLGRQPVGTGPYKFVEWSTGEHVLEERNPSYWGPKPPTGKLQWTWTSETAVMNMAVRSGDADVVNPLPAAFVGPLKSQRTVKVLEGNSAAVFWVSLNVQLKPLDDARVRQALNYATDRVALVHALLDGFGTPANSPLAPVTQFYDPSVKGYPYDLVKAKALLAQAGYANGISINVAVQAAQANICEALQGMWAKAGIKLDVLQMEPAVWTQAAFGNPDQKAKQGIYSVLASWAAGTFDADLQLRPLYDTASWAPGSANLGFYSNKDLDQILDKAGSDTDARTRRVLYQQAQRIIVSDAPHVLLYYPKDLAAVRSNVKGLWLIPGGEVMAAAASVS